VFFKKTLFSKVFKSLVLFKFFLFSVFLPRFFNLQTKANSLAANFFFNKLKFFYYFFFFWFFSLVDKFFAIYWVRLVFFWLRTFFFFNMGLFFWFLVSKEDLFKNLEYKRLVFFNYVNNLVLDINFFWNIAHRLNFFFKHISGLSFSGHFFFNGTTKIKPLVAISFAQDFFFQWQLALKNLNFPLLLDNFFKKIIRLPYNFRRQSPYTGFVKKAFSVFKKFKKFDFVNYYSYNVFKNLDKQKFKFLNYVWHHKYMVTARRPKTFNLFKYKISNFFFFFFPRWRFPGFTHYFPLNVFPYRRRFFFKRFPKKVKRKHYFFDIHQVDFLKLFKKSRFFKKFFKSFRFHFQQAKRLYINRKWFPEILDFFLENQVKVPKKLGFFFRFKSLGNFPWANFFSWVFNLFIFFKKILAVLFNFFRPILRVPRPPALGFLTSKALMEGPRRPFYYFSLFFHFFLHRWLWLTKGKVKRFFLAKKKVKRFFKIFSFNKFIEINKLFFYNNRFFFSPANNFIRDFGFKGWLRFFF